MNTTRRRLLAAGAMTLAAAQLGMVGSAAAQSRKARPGIPAIRPGTHTSLDPLKQVDAGLLSVGYAEAGPAGGPAVILLHGSSLVSPPERHSRPDRPALDSGSPCAPLDAPDDLRKQALGQLAFGQPHDEVSGRTEDAPAGLEEPLLVGFSREGDRSFESWAGLTDAQAASYLGRLPEDRAGLLLFIVPRPRRLERTRPGYAVLSDVQGQPDGLRWVTCGGQRQIGIASWNYVVVPSQLGAE